MPGDMRCEKGVKAKRGGGEEERRRGGHACGLMCVS